MPFVTIDRDATDTMVFLARRARRTEAVAMNTPGDHPRYAVRKFRADYALGREHGYNEALRRQYPDSFGFMVMDCDEILGGREPFTNSLPRLVVTR